jgi:uncharacterized protein (DUF952 family)
MKFLYHITTVHQAVDAQRNGHYLPVKYDQDGFIHCSYIHQVAPVANRLFAGKRDLVLLKVNPASLKSRIVDENLEGGTELFPHIYGPIEWTAVLEVIPFHADLHGHFHAPSGE